MFFPIAGMGIGGKLGCLNFPLMSNSTIAAIATAPGTGAVALIRVSGGSALDVAGRVFSGRPRDSWIPRQQHFGRILDSAGQILDEVLLCAFLGPNSFTGEDVVEITCHGGVHVTHRILETLLEAGAEAAAPGEFSERAFLNGRLDLTQAEAIMDVISARTDLALRAAGQQLGGLLGREVEEIRQDLVSILAHVEAYIDFPEEDIEPESFEVILESIRQIEQRLKRLLSTARQGQMLREGIRTVLCGPPNAGKSSLLNRLLGYQRAIVSDQAGTTRDTIEALIDLKGIPLMLVDTAGLREVGEEIEQQGVARSREQIAGAELVIFVVDANQSADDVEMVEVPAGATSVMVLNKSDLPQHDDWKKVEGISVSTREEASVDAFREALYALITEDTELRTSGDMIAINVRHQRCLQVAQSALDEARQALLDKLSPEFVSIELREALSAIGDIVGRTDTETILGEIFANFCIGK